MSLVKLTSPSKSAAPGQYLGFSLQQVRLCNHLLRAHDDDSVSLEHADDVALHRADGSLLLEQAKSALSGNPASDRSEELWKSFANWGDRCAEGIDPATTDFVLYVTPAKTGDLVIELHQSLAKEAVAAVLEKVKALINPKTPDVGCAPDVARFLKVGDATCSRIIERFRFVTEEDPLESVRQLLRPVLPTDAIDDFCAAAIGIARDQADKLIRQKMPAIVPAAEFRKQFGAFVRKYDLLGLLHSTTQPTTAAVSAVVDTAPVFVRQLNAVQASQDMLVTAVNDYLRTQSDKVEWADEGLIVANSLDELDGQLERQHRILRDEIEDTMNLQAEGLRGRTLYRKCTATTLPLEGRVLPPHFIPGEFNCLADARRLGWHPQYKILFPVK